MIRYADVLLMKAEALNSIDDTSNDKYDALNEVRGRAGLTSITAADNLNKNNLPKSYWKKDYMNYVVNTCAAGI